MAPLNLDVKAMAYLRSESEFSRARLRGFVEMMMGLITGHNMHLLSFDEVVEKLRLKQAIYRGLHDIPIANIAGSTGRYEDFTRRFLTRSSVKRHKERWRNIYTLAVTGQGFPPIDVYKIDQVYFVKDGNHRVSVARELGWQTIQAHVTELPSSISLGPEVEPDELLIKGECAYFLEKTHLDQTRPDSTETIEITAPGGYRRLLNHIELHRCLVEKEQGRPLAEDHETAFELAAASWYDQVYLPIIEALRQANILKHFPGRTETDLYIWLIKNQSALRKRHHLDELDLPSAVGFWLAYIKKVAPGDELGPINLPGAVEEFLQSM
ncbi:MAG: hypothetical protein AB1801_19865 [Chloroflexota bacterium]